MFGTTGNRRENEAVRQYLTAIWNPSSGPEGLKALRELHPDADMAPTAEVRAEWPRDVPRS